MTDKRLDSAVWAMRKAMKANDCLSVSMLLPAHMVLDSMDVGIRPAGATEQWLCCQLPTAVFRHFKRGFDTLRHAVSVVRFPSGITYMFVTSEVQGMQHRFVIPMVGDSLRGFLDGLCAGESMTVLFGHVQDGQVLIACAGNRDEEMQAMDVPGAMSSAQADVAPLLEELAGIGTALTSPGLAYSLCEGVEVSRVCVSMLIPVELKRVMDLLLASFDGPQCMV